MSARGIAGVDRGTKGAFSTLGPRPATPLPPRPPFSCLSPPTKSDSLALLVAMCIAGMAFASVAVSTRWGVGASFDSTIYITAARNLLAGQGLSLPDENGNPSPLTHHAPLYPALLAAIGWISGHSPLATARWLNAVLFAANASLVIGLIRWRTGGLLWPLIGGAILLSSVDVLRIHVLACSEGLFVLLATGALWMLAIALQRDRVLMLLASASLMGLAVVTRYAGLALLGSSVLAIIAWRLLNPGPGVPPVPFPLSTSHRVWIRRPYADAALFTTVAALPLVGWLVRNQLSADTYTNRKLSFHPISLSHLKQAVFTGSAWLLPESVPGPVRWAVLVVFLALVVALAVWQRRCGWDRRLLHPLSLVVGLAMAVYGAFLVVSISFFDFATPLDSRILTPVFYVLGLVLLVAMAHALPRHTRRVGICILAAFLCLNIARVASRIRELHAEGLGYTGRSWVTSPLVSRVRQMPVQTAIHTNGSQALRFLTGQRVVELPIKEDPITNERNDRFGQELRDMEQVLRRTGGVIAYFTTLPAAFWPTEAELRQALPLVVVERVGDGTIYAIAR